MQKIKKIVRAVFEKNCWLLLTNYYDTNLIGPSLVQKTMSGKIWHLENFRLFSQLELRLHIGERTWMYIWMDGWTTTTTTTTYYYYLLLLLCLRPMILMLMYLGNGHGLVTGIGKTTRAGPSLFISNFVSKIEVFAHFLKNGSNDLAENPYLDRLTLLNPFFGHF